MNMLNCKHFLRGIKIAAVFGIAFSVFSQLAVGEDVPELTGIVVPPANIEVIPDSKLPRLVARLEERDAAKAFDRNIDTGFTAFGSSTLKIELPENRTLNALRIYGKSPYRMSVEALGPDGATKITGFQSVDLSALDEAWNTLHFPKDGVVADHLQIALEPIPGGGTGLFEVEIWADGTHVNIPETLASLDADYQAPSHTITLSPLKQQSDDEIVIGASSTPANSKGIVAQSLADRIGGSGEDLEFAVPFELSSIAKAFLVYDLYGLSHWNESARSINGKLHHGGHVSRETNSWSIQAEAISPLSLRSGRNRIRFEPSSAAALSYRIRNVRLVIEPHDGWTFLQGIESNQPDAAAVIDGDLNTYWRISRSNVANSALDKPHLIANFAELTSLEKLQFVVTGEMTGTYSIEVLTDKEWETVAANLSSAELLQGWNSLGLRGVKASALKLSFEGDDGSAGIAELQISGSPVEAPDSTPSLTIAFPDAGQYFGDTAYIRGFTRPESNGLGPSRIIVAGKPVPSVSGVFEVAVSKADLEIPQSQTEWSVEVEAVYPNGERVAQHVTLSTNVSANQSDQIDGATQALYADLQPGSAREIAHMGAKLEVAADALETKTRILMRPLRDVDLPELDPGMINVTRGEYRGFRFLPHGHHFRKPVKVRLPFDSTKLPSGMTEADIKTYFFETTTGRWQPLPLTTVDMAQGEVESETTHFTDMINAVVQTPDSPEATSFNPTQIKDLKVANPGAGVNLIAPPSANAHGDVRLSYPIELAPGRAGMTPQLSLTYNSAGGNGWVGMGWDLAMSSVMIDTRWGVPRYDTADETETYMVDGEQLAPLAHRGPLVPREAERSFRTRIEGSFRRITRHGNAPNNYWWEVRQKDGTAYFYGGDPATNGPAADSTLIDADGNIYMWALREVRDTNGNVIRYRHEKVSDSGADGGGSAAQGTELYCKTIEYTGRDGETGAYLVTLTRDSELGEPRRPDVMMDARGGFKRVTADLLRKIELTFNRQTVRSYELTYKIGAFSKTLLDKVEQFDADGELFNGHQFSYFDEARDGSGAYKGFDTQRADWNTGSDDVVAQGLIGELDASALGSHEGRSAGGHLYLGVGPLPTKTNSVGFKTGSESGASRGLLALIDINGDGLPDKVFREGGQIFYRANRSGPNEGASTTFGPRTQVANLPAINEERHSTTSLGPEAHVGISFVGGFIGANRATTDTESSVYFADVNGDGLVDLVNRGAVLFNSISSSGDPVFTPNSADTPYPIGTGAVANGILSDELQEAFEREIAANRKIDTVRRWVAPFSGTIAVTGAVALMESTDPDRAAYETADGVRIAIQLNANEIWSTTIAATDYTPKTPSGVGAISVQKDDILYFRVQSINDGAFDQVSWAPVITYSGPAAVDSNGLNPFAYDASEDFTLISGRAVDVTMIFDGTVRVTGQLNKTATISDDVVLEVLKNGTAIATQTIPAAATGNFVLNETISVLAEEFDTDGNQTQTADRLAIRLLTDSRIDLNALTWDPANPPRITYTASPDIPSGAPFPVIDVPVSTELYPESTLVSGPLVPWIATATGSTTFQADIQGVPGTAILTVKAEGAPLAKQTVTIGTPQNFTVSVNAGQAVFFEYHIRNNTTGAAVTSQSVNEVESDGSIGAAVLSALYYASVDTILQQRYRGWNAFGYDGNLAAGEQPIQITADDLSLERLGDIDRDAYRADLESAVENGTDPTVDTAPFELKVFTYVPDVAESRLEGPDEELWAAADSVSSSRHGRNFIADPSLDPFAGAQAVPYKSVSSQFALAGGIGFDIGGIGIGGSASKADTNSRAILEFRDMNGDFFPDVVTSGIAVQFSPATGGLEDTTVSVGAGGQPQATSSEAVSFGINGSYANSQSNSKAEVDTKAGNQTSAPGKTNQSEATLGVSGDISQGASDVDFDLVDMNGDGLPDRVSASGSLGSDGSLTVQINLGYSFAPAEVWGLGKINEGKNEGQSVGGTIGFNNGNFGFAGGINASANESNALHSLQDINGDGLPDRVRVSAGNASTIAVAFNTGSGFTELYDWGGANGAGLANNIQRTDGGGGYFTYGFCPFLVGICIITNPGADFTRSVGRTESTIADIDGDGFPDHLISTSDDSITVGRNPTERTNLLKSVERPLGGRFEVAYDRIGNTFEQQQSRFVLSRLVVEDGQPGDGQDLIVSTFAYEDGFYERRERQFYGFRKCVETQRDPAAGEAPYRTITRIYENDSYYLAGLLESETVTNASGNKFTETEHTYVVRNEATDSDLTDLNDLTAVAFPARVRTDRRWFEGQATAGKTTFETFEYDVYGNVERYIDGSDQGPADDVEAVIEYFEDLPNYIVGKANSIIVRSNGQEYRRRTANFETGTGNLLELRHILAGGGTALSSLTYTPDGNIATMSGPANHGGQRYQLSYSYDPTVRTHVARVEDSFGYVSTAEYDLRWGLQSQLTDINNQTISTTFDVKGRIQDVTGPYEQGTGLKTIQMEYHPEAAIPWALTKHIDVDRNPNDFIETATFIDGLQRVTQTKKDHTLHTGGGATSDVMVVSGATIYDGFGRAIEQYYPITEPLGLAGVLNTGVDPVTPTRTSFDILDRPLSVANPADETTQFVYNFGADRLGVQQFRTRVTDANGIQREVFRDVDDDITTVTLFNNGGSQILRTSYGYDALDQIVSVTDDQNNVTTAAYDNFGRRIEINSPDSGRTQYVFDLASNLRNKITANLRAASQQVTYNYDFNRLASITYPQNPQNNVAYTYGDPGASFNQANRVAVMTAESGRLEQQYGPLGEVVKETRTVDQDVIVTGDPTYTTEFRYDTWNRLQSLTYPDGEVLTFEYDAGGLVQKITGQNGTFTYPYLTFKGYDKFEARERVEYGNGSKTDYAYNPLNRRLSGLLAKTAAGRSFMDMAYTYDQVGNITALANNADIQSYGQKGGRSSFAFDYDDLYQLTSATGHVQQLAAAANKFTLSMAYDSIHNITRKNQRAYMEYSNGAQTPVNSVTYDYSYSYASGKPHAASLIGNRAFLYDLNGNQAGWDATNSGFNRRNQWDEDNRIQEVRDNYGQPVTFKYDDDNNRVIKRATNGETHYVNQWYTGRLGHANKHVFAGTTRIVTKVQMPNYIEEVGRYFYHPDHLGTNGYITDRTGEVWQHLEYFPFGETWLNEVTDNRLIPYRFTGKEFDEETQLYYFGSRYYDPRTSVWQSPDPALGQYLTTTKTTHTKPSIATDWQAHLLGAGQGGVFEPRNLNSFGYTAQNPVRFVDADGELFFVPILLGAAYVADKAYAAYEGYQDYKAIQRGEKTVAEVATERASEQAAGVVFGAAGRGGVKGTKALRRFWKGNPCNSFDASTLVVTKDGLKRIDQLSVNELVLARNEETGETDWKQISDRFIGQHEETVRIRLERADGKGQEEIVSSKNHPIFVEGKGWIEAGKLAAGDQIVSALGEGHTNVVSVKIEKQPLLAYNLEVAEHHTFFIGESQAWVHNGNPCDLGDAARMAKIRIEGHHAYPMYLGGKFKQDLENLTGGLHDEFHRGLDKILPRRATADYYSKLNPAERAQMRTDLLEYTREFDKKHGTDLTNALVREFKTTP